MKEDQKRPAKLGFVLHLQSNLDERVQIANPYFPVPTACGQPLFQDRFCLFQREWKIGIVQNLPGEVFAGIIGL